MGRDLLLLAALEQDFLAVDLQPALPRPTMVVASSGLHQLQRAVVWVLDSLGVARSRARAQEMLAAPLAFLVLRRLPLVPALELAFSVVVRQLARLQPMLVMVFLGHRPLHLAVLQVLDFLAELRRQAGELIAVGVAFLALHRLPLQVGLQLGFLGVDRQQAYPRPVLAPTFLGHRLSHIPPVRAPDCSQELLRQAVARQARPLGTRVRIAGETKKGDLRKRRTLRHWLGQLEAQQHRCI